MNSLFFFIKYLMFAFLILILQYSNNSFFESWNIRNNSEGAFRLKTKRTLSENILKKSKSESTENLLDAYEKEEINNKQDEMEKDLIKSKAQKSNFHSHIIRKPSETKVEISNENNVNKQKVTKCKDKFISTFFFSLVFLSLPLYLVYLSHMEYFFNSKDHSEIYHFLMSHCILIISCILCLHLRRVV
ncbi:conserved Plasmodium protein, unknown function [Plasmodium gallinaceum]|uniref:Fam-h protein n=1 Tax=Plasmodium gallinaceum TaxID=5849 RepID=A0A1J1GQA9_PLAGA|nr:conserved Plasmodium protein, unknown function [Plasmodium gallinaceum]CRG94487.1 conserved Plasmodium protein, unknown function [Plasmodium gallinaceum]